MIEKIEEAKLVLDDENTFIPYRVSLKDVEAEDFANFLEAIRTKKPMAALVHGNSKEMSCYRVSDIKEIHIKDTNKKQEEK